MICQLLVPSEPGPAVHLDHTEGHTEGRRRNAALLTILTNPACVGESRHYLLDLM